MVLYLQFDQSAMVDIQKQHLRLSKLCKFFSLKDLSPIKPYFSQILSIKNTLTLQMDKNSFTDAEARKVFFISYNIQQIFKTFSNNHSLESSLSQYNDTNYPYIKQILSKQSQDYSFEAQLSSSQDKLQELLYSILQGSNQQTQWKLTYHHYDSGSKKIYLLYLSPELLSMTNKYSINLFIYLRCLKAYSKKIVIEFNQNGIMIPLEISINFWTHLGIRFINQQIDYTSKKYKNQEQVINHHIIFGYLLKRMKIIDQQNKHYILKLGVQPFINENDFKEDSQSIEIISHFIHVFLKVYLNEDKAQPDIRLQLSIFLIANLVHSFSLIHSLRQELQLKRYIQQEYCELIKYNEKVTSLFMKKYYNIIGKRLKSSTKQRYIFKEIYQLFRQLSKELIQQVRNQQNEDIKHKKNMFISLSRFITATLTSKNSFNLSQSLILKTNLWILYQNPCINNRRKIIQLQMQSQLVINLCSLLQRHRIECTKHTCLLMTQFIPIVQLRYQRLDNWIQEWQNNYLSPMSQENRQIYKDAINAIETLLAPYNQNIRVIINGLNAQPNKVYQEYSQVKLGYLKKQCPKNCQVCQDYRFIDCAKRCQVLLSHLSNLQETFNHTDQPYDYQYAELAQRWSQNELNKIKRQNTFL